MEIRNVSYRSEYECQLNDSLPVCAGNLSVCVGLFHTCASAVLRDVTGSPGLL